MSSPSFASFVREVHGYEPFPWQQRLAERLLAGEVPDAIHVPTGMGKTSVLDASVFALAAGSGATDRWMTTRVALVVDRRLVVDAAFEHATKIADALTSPQCGPTTAWVRDRLLACRGGAEGLTHPDPLAVVRMRGGVTWDARWLRAPDQPAIILGTVDQFGSRLLFRGYGQSDRLRPIDAALVGRDCLCFLDEAHLSGALVESGATITDMESCATSVVGRPLRMVPMTATSTVMADDVLALDDADLKSAAGPRLQARKRVTAVQLAGSMGKKPDQAMSRLAQHLALDEPSAIGVVVNTVSLARSTFDALKSLAGDDFDVDLVIGRCRPADRAARESDWMGRVGVGRQRPIERSHVLVATQTIEVGVDLDFDVLITQSASLDAVIQRFGRVDRLGVAGSTRSFLVRTLREDPVYGDSERETWDTITSEADPIEWSTRPTLGDVVAAEPTIDLGPLAAGEWLKGRDISPLVAPQPPIPPVTAATVSIWRRTAPVPQPDEAVAPYLHGVGRWSPTVSVAWRHGIDTDSDDQVAAANRQLRSVPLASGELVEVPLNSLRGLLRGELVDTADLDGVDLGPRKATSREAVHQGWVRREASSQSADLAWQRVDASQIGPGDVVVLDSGVGGHDAYGWSGRSDEPVIDVGGLTAMDGARLRLDAGWLSQLTGDDWTEGEVQEWLTADRFDDDLRIEVVSRLNHAPPCSHSSLLASAASRLSNAQWDVERADGKPTSATLVTLGGAHRFRETSDDGDDSSTVAAADAPSVTLSQHLGAVGDRAGVHAVALGLSSDLVAAVRLAGSFHDLGKAEVRFQELLHQGRRFDAETARFDADRALAKSVRLPRRVEREIARRAGWVGGLRHEAVSLALVRSAPDDLFDDVDRPLVEHLVASHHGHARPFFPPVLDASPSTTAVTYAGISFSAEGDARQVGLDHASVFEQLCKTYGTWGLALLEAIVRLADMSVSEEGS